MLEVLSCGTSLHAQLGFWSPWQARGSPATFLAQGAPIHCWLLAESSMSSVEHIFLGVNPLSTPVAGHPLPSHCLQSLLTYGQEKEAQPPPDSCLGAKWVKARLLQPPLLPKRSTRG